MTMKEEISELWKNFRYSYTKKQECVLTNRELFDLFKAEVKRVISSIELLEPF
jgi:hypothetical protein